MAERTQFRRGTVVEFAPWYVGKHPELTGEIRVIDSVKSYQTGKTRREMYELLDADGLPAGTAAASAIRRARPSPRALARQVREYATARPNSPRWSRIASLSDDELACIADGAKTPHGALVKALDATQEGTSE